MWFNISILLCTFTSINSLFFSKLGLWFSKGNSVAATSLDAANTQYPIYCEESLMNNKGHGTCINSVMKKLRWNCNFDTADRICCFNRHYAEYAGYWESTSFLDEVDKEKEITFFDSVTGKPLFIAPRGRSFEDFRKESLSHGWPSFRDNEVVWENVRCLKNGEAISIDGTHLGHNLPDRKGNRYCINLVSVAGLPPAAEL
eukprot:gene26373-35011_t